MAVNIRTSIIKKTGLNLRIASEVKCLGLDKAAGRKRATTATQKRQKAAAERTAKAKKLGRAGQIGAKIVATAAMLQMAYNRATQGTAPTELAKLQTMAASACQMNSSGSCATTFISITYGEYKDPAYVLMAAQIKEWLRAWVKQKSQRKRTARAWAVAMAWLSKVPERKRWRRVKGSRGALILSLQSIGWVAKGPRGLWMCN